MRVLVGSIKMGCLEAQVLLAWWTSVNREKLGYIKDYISVKI
jgi:hypothetical protein